MKINIILKEKWIAYIGSKLYIDNNPHHLNESFIDAGKAPLNVILSFPFLLLVKNKRILLKDNAEEVNLKVTFSPKKSIFVRLLLSTLSLGILVSMVYHSINLAVLLVVVLSYIITIWAILANEITLEKI